MHVTGFSARNIGDGRFVELNWSTVDPSQVKYFIVERWDRHRQRWVPYDGFHGLVHRQVTELDDNPPQRILVEIDDHAPSQQSFRIRALLHDGTESEAVTTSVQFASTGQVIGDAKVWFVREGLLVVQDGPRTLEVQPGSAVTAGVDRAVPRALHLELPLEVNAFYVVWINQNGIVGFSGELPEASMALAHVTVDAEGVIQEVVDVRFLWPPETFSAQGITGRFPGIGLSWSASAMLRNALNLKGWRIYRAHESGDFEFIAELPKASATHTDRYFPEFSGVYRYVITAVDWGENESRPSEEVTADFESIQIPLPPTNVRGWWSGDWRNPIIVLQWDHSPSSNIERYNIYSLSGGEWSFEGAVDYPGQQYVHTFASLRSEWTFAVTAVNESRAESELSLPATIVVGPQAPPKKPEWTTSAPMTTGQDPDGTVWVRLEWRAVTERTNGEPLAPVSPTNPAGLQAYRIWKVDGEELRFAGEVLPAQTDFTITGLTPGTVYTYVITAIDGWMLESDPSDPKSIAAGDRRVPDPPTITSLTSLRQEGTEIVELRWAEPTHYTLLGDESGESQPLPEGLIREYIIYRGLSPLILEEIGRTEDPVFYDAAVLRGQEYHYAVRAVTKTHVLSDFSGIASLRVGDFDAPDAPEIVLLSTAVVEEGGAFTVRNTLTWDWPDERPEDLRGVAIYVSVPPAGFQRIGFVPYSPQEPEIKTFVHDNLANGQRYWYAVSAIDLSGNESALSQPQSIVAGSIIRPAAPWVQAASGFADGTAYIDLSWAAVTDDENGGPLSVSIHRYRIERSTTGLEFGPLAETSSTAFRDAYLLNGKRYWYRVIAIDELGNESLPGAANALAGDTTPPAVPIVTHQIRLDPSAPSVAQVDIEAEAHAQDTDVVAFIVYASDNGSKWSRIGITEDGRFVDTVPYGAFRQYRIVAVDEAGNEGSPATFSVTAVADDPVDPVDDLLLSLAFDPDPSGRFTAKLTWQYNAASSFARFEIYRTVGSDDVLVGVLTDPSAASFQEHGLAGGTAYQYGIAVVDVFGQKSSVTYIQGTPQKTSDPKPPTNVTAKSELARIAIRWTEPTEDTDGQPLIGLKGYRVQGSTDNFENVEFETFALADHVFHDNDDYAHAWTYRVRTEDVFGKFSSWVLSNAATPQSLDISFIEDAIPDAPSGLFATTGLDVSSEDETTSAWVELSWDAVQSQGLSGYYVEMSEDGETWHRIAQAAADATSIRIAGLLTGATLYFRVLAFNRVNTASDPSSSVEVTVAGDERIPPAPETTAVIEGKSLIALHWSPVEFVRLDAYELEFQETEIAETADPERWPPTWEPLARVKTTFFVHDELAYDKYYRYRIRSVSLSNVASDWTVINPDGNRPRQFGQQDIAAQSVVANLLAADIIEGYHIKARTVTGGHLQMESIDTEHLKTKIIKAEHVDIRPGNRNWVKNSAFGMRDLNGDLGVDWQLSGDIQIVDNVQDTPIGDYSLWLSAVQATGSPLAVQALPDALIGQTVILSAYARWTNVVDDGAGTGGFIELIDASSGDVITSLRFVGGAGWTRIFSEPVEIPGTVAEPVLRVRMSGTTGDLWVTGLKIETGDVATDWLPYPGETYQAQGQVQINSDGLRITNGRVLIETDSGRVRLDGTGLFASDGIQHFASLTHEGLSIVNGKFSLQTAGGSVKIDGGGIVAYRSGNVSVQIGSDGKLTVHDGNLSFKTASSGSRLELDASGLRTYGSTGSETFTLTSSGELTLKGGQFQILTAASTSAPGIALTGSGLSARDASGETFRIGVDGSIHLTRKFTVGPVNPGEHDRYLQLTPQRLYSQDGTGKSFELRSDGSALFTGGSVTIQSSTADAGKQVVFDADGIFLGEKGEDPVFMVTQGFGEIDPGVYIRNGHIRCGDVTIDPNGIIIDGAQGLVVRTQGVAPETILEATHQGLKLKGGAGLQIEGSGKITFLPSGGGPAQTAIDASGIHAQAIRTGVLTINGSSLDSLPRIEVKDGSTTKVQIDKSGIQVFDGAFNLVSSQGETVIANGEIQTSALRIGTVGGSNALRNGRGDFGTEGWIASASVTVVSTIGEQNIPAGVSGSYAFRLQSSSQAEDMRQAVSHYDFGTDIHSLTAWIYLVSGSLRVQVADAEPPDVQGGYIEELFDQAGSWVLVHIPFVRKGGTPEVRFVNASESGTTIAYITDVCITRGRHSSAFRPHPTELASAGGQVKINDQGIVVQNGKIQVTTANGSVTLNDTGLFGPNFTLNAQGLALAFPDQKITVSSQGIKAGDTSYALLHSGGLKVVGGAVDIQGTGGQMKITDNLIEMTESGTAGGVWIRPSGLEVSGGKFKITSGSSIDDSIWIGPYGMRIGNQENNPSISLGIAPSSWFETIPSFFGLGIKNGNFRIEYENKITDSLYGEITYTVLINGEGVRVERQSEHPDVPHRYSQLTSDRLIVGGHDIENRGAIAFVDSGTVRLEGGQAQVNFNFPFDDPPHLIVTPSFYQTYSTKYNNYNQGVEVTTSDLTNTGFRVNSSVLIDSAALPLEHVSGHTSFNASQKQWIGKSAFFTQRIRISVWLFAAWTQWSRITVYVRPEGSSNWEQKARWELKSGFFDSDRSDNYSTMINLSPGGIWEVRVDFASSADNCYGSIKEASAFDFDSRPVDYPIEIQWLAIERT